MTASLLDMRILQNEKESLRSLGSLFSLLLGQRSVASAAVRPYLSFSSLLSSCIKVLMSLNWR